MAVILPRVRTEAPRFDCPIDYSNPLSKGLIGFITPFNTKKGIRQTRFGKVGFYANDTDAAEFNVPITPRAITGFTIATNAQATNDGPSTCLAGLGSAADAPFNPAAGALLSQIFDNINFYGVDSNTYGTDRVSTIASDGSLRFCAARKTVNSNEASVFVDGVTSSLGVPFTNGTTPVTINSLRIYQKGTNNVDTPVNGWAEYFAFWDRSLSDAELNSFRSNPWQLFKPTKQFLSFAESGGASGTISVTTANDTSAISGTTSVIGAISNTTANDTIAASGTTSIVGNLNITTSNDVMAASGSVGAGVSGSINVTTNDDSAVLTGTTAVTGTLGVTTNNDTIAASGFAGATTGAINVTNNNDAMQASGFTPQSNLFGGVGHFKRLDEDNQKRKLKTPAISLETLDNVEYSTPKQDVAIKAVNVVIKPLAIERLIDNSAKLEIQAQLRDEIIKEYLSKVEQQEEEQAIVMMLMALA